MAWYRHVISTSHARRARKFLYRPFNPRWFDVEKWNFLDSTTMDKSWLLSRIACVSILQDAMLKIARASFYFYFWILDARFRDAVVASAPCKHRGLRFRITLWSFLALLRPPLGSFLRLAAICSVVRKYPTGLTFYLEITNEWRTVQIRWHVYPVGIARVCVCMCGLL